MRVSRSVCLPDGQRSCPALPCLSAQLCSPPLIAFINYIIKSVMTERRLNHLPSSLSLAGPLFQLNCRVIVCWVPKLPFSCNRPTERTNCVCPKNHFHFPLISLGIFFVSLSSSLSLFLDRRLVICLRCACASTLNLRSIVVGLSESVEEVCAK